MFSCKVSGAFYLILYTGLQIIYLTWCLNVQPAGQSSLADSIGGLSRLATSFIPYARDIVGEISRRDYYAVALTDEVVVFADNIAMHPETWLDFPSLEEDEDDGKSWIYGSPHGVVRFLI